MVEAARTGRNDFDHNQDVTGAQQSTITIHAVVGQLGGLQRIDHRVRHDLPGEDATVTGQLRVGSMG